MKWINAKERLPGWKQVVRWRVNGVQRNTPQSISMFQYQGLIDIDDFEWCEEDSYPPEASQGQRELPDCKNCKAPYEKCECGKYESPTTADASVLKEALVRIESLEVPEEEEFTFDPGDFIFQLKGIARKALAQYNTQSNLSGQIDDPLLWIKVLKEATGLQSYDQTIFKSLKSKYHITQKP